jgi:hypothetical protein
VHQPLDRIGQRLVEVALDVALLARVVEDPDAQALLLGQGEARPVAAAGHSERRGGGEG